MALVFWYLEENGGADDRLGIRSHHEPKHDALPRFCAMRNAGGDISLPSL
jgi:hypothetical protein